MKQLQRPLVRGEMTRGVSWDYYNKKVIVEICTFFVLIAALSCISVRTYSAGDDDSSVEVGRDSLERLVKPSGKPDVDP